MARFELFSEGVQLKAKNNMVEIFESVHSLLYYYVLFYFLYFLELYNSFFSCDQTWCTCFHYCLKNVLYLTMNNDVTAYRMAIGLLYCRSCLVSKKCRKKVNDRFCSNGSIKITFRIDGKV
jgi:hypothetical protein